MYRGQEIPWKNQLAPPTEETLPPDMYGEQWVPPPVQSSPPSLSSMKPSGDVLPRRSADPATMAADMRQLTTAPEKPAPLINGVDWSINQDRLVDPSVQEFQ